MQRKSTRLQHPVRTEALRQMYRQAIQNHPAQGPFEAIARGGPGLGTGRQMHEPSVRTNHFMPRNAASPSPNLRPRGPMPPLRRQPIPGAPESPWEMARPIEASNLTTAPMLNIPASIRTRTGCPGRASVV